MSMTTSRMTSSEKAKLIALARTMPAYAGAAEAAAGGDKWALRYLVGSLSAPVLTPITESDIRAECAAEDSIGGFCD